MSEMKKITFQNLNVVDIFYKSYIRSYLSRDHLLKPQLW